jgi:dCTP deaminase
MTILSDNEIIGLCSHNGNMLCLLSSEDSEELYKMPIPPDELGKTEIAAQIFDFIKRSQTHYDADFYATFQRTNEGSLLVQGRPMTEEEKEQYKPMISPFHANQVREVNDQKVISFGTSSFGYDVTLSEEFKIFTNINSSIIDPKRFNEKCLVDGVVREDEETGEKYVILPPNSYLLGRTTEYFVIPRDVMVICLGKSTYARAGAIVNVTPIESGFEGNVVIEVSNSTNLPLKIYANEGISQFVLYRGNRDCRTSYADRAGKYQGQTGITLSKV